MWQLLPMALGAGANYLAGKKNQDAQSRMDEANNARSLREYNAQMHMEAANMAAQNQYMGALAEAGNAQVAGQNEAFEYLKNADKNEEEARKNLADAIAGFGKTSKEAKLAAAKAKRAGNVAKAVKGTKVKGTKGAGRQNIRGKLGKAVTSGLAKASDTSALAAGLGAYGADLSREMGEYNELSGDNAALGNFAKWGRETASERESLANKDAATRRQIASGTLSNQQYGNRLLGPNFLPHDPLTRIDPGTSGLNAFSTLMGGLAGYNGKNPFAQQNTGSYNLDNTPQVIPKPQPPAYYGSKAYPYGGY